MGVTAATGVGCAAAECSLFGIGSDSLTASTSTVVSVIVLERIIGDGVGSMESASELTIVALTETVSSRITGDCIAV